MKTLKFSPNLSTLYGEVGCVDRFERAAADGFRAVEFWFPYEEGVEAIQARVAATGLRVVLFNLHPGDQPGEWGTLGNPHRRDFFRASFTTALEAAARLDCPQLHLMFGNRVEGVPPEAQVECAHAHLAWAAPQAAQAGVTLLIEALNPLDFPRVFLRTTRAAYDLVAQFNHPNLRLQYDLYHAQLSEGNLANTLAACLDRIGHIQVADAPGRNQPGTGEINFAFLFDHLERLGYGGYIGLEYRPRGSMAEALEWLPWEDRTRA